ncbi:Retrovirus-related Pol polyprotein from transposon TNT 1-94 [Sesbania bispinosa]|nr:Retrovirus-related Pol polyprotein from transposon TNT 1-94 [Sesbania bispinosa]
MSNVSSDDVIAHPTTKSSGGENLQRKIILDQINPEQIQPQMIDDQMMLDTQTNPEPQTMEEDHTKPEPRRSKRVKIPSTKYPPDQYVILTSEGEPQFFRSYGDEGERRMDQSHE